MMRLIKVGTIYTISLAALVAMNSTLARALENERTEGTQTSEATADELTAGDLKGEVVGIKPMAGFLDFSADGTDLSDARFAGGFALDFNMTKYATDDSMLYLGPSTGFIYSRLGGNNFIGRDDSDANPGIDAFFVPANLKLGVNVLDNLRISGHGGGNVAYFSRAGVRDDRGFTVFPNVGGDLEVGFGKHVSMLVRPDWMFTSNGGSIFTGMAGIGILLG